MGLKDTNCCRGSYRVNVKGGEQYCLGNYQRCLLLTRGGTQRGSSCAFEGVNEPVKVSSF